MLRYLADNIDERLKNNNLSSRPDENFATLFQGQFCFFHDRPHFVVAVFLGGLMEENQRVNKMILQLIYVKIKYLTPVISDGQEKGIFTNEISTEQ